MTYTTRITNLITFNGPGIECNPIMIIRKSLNNVNYEKSYTGIDSEYLNYAFCYLINAMGMDS